MGGTGMNYICVLYPRVGAGEAIDLRVGLCDMG